MFAYICKTENNLQSLIEIHPLWAAPRIRGIYATCDFSHVLPFFLRSSRDQTGGDNFTHNNLKDAVGRKKGLYQQVFPPFPLFGGHVPKNLQNLTPSRETLAESKNVK